MIKEWIQRISSPENKLGGMPICPFAKKTEYELIESDGSDINPPPWDFEIIIYKLPDHYTVNELSEIAIEYNALYPEIVFLPDHKDRDTFINGVQTNNGKYNLILCQWRDNLKKARDKLEKTSYYTHWNSEYLEEILKS